MSCINNWLSFDGLLRDGKMILLSECKLTGGNLPGDYDYGD